MAVKISLIHPSRGRSQKSFSTTQLWLMAYENAFVNKYIEGIGTQVSYDFSNDIELIVSVDTSDPECNQYIQLYSGVAKFLVNDNTCVVQATNRAAEHATGDILIYVSDDFMPHEGWGKNVIREFADAAGPRLIKVDDCLQKFDVPVLTIPIMNRALYERLGYFWHPEYKSMFVDEDLYWTATKLNALKMCPHLKFPHEHVSIGKAVMDETYRRSSANWDQGKAVFAKRKTAGFPI